LSRVWRSCLACRSATGNTGMRRLSTVSALRRAVYSWLSRQERKEICRQGWSALYCHFVLCPFFGQWASRLYKLTVNPSRDFSIRESHLQLQKIGRYGVPCVYPQSVPAVGHYGVPCVYPQRKVTSGDCDSMQHASAQPLYVFIPCILYDYVHFAINPSPRKMVISTPIVTLSL
jgi:hypothetical protein